MSEQRSSTTGVPEVTLGWRMKMALGHAHMTVQEMADEAGMSRQQLSRYLNDKGERPRRAILVTWALRTGVPLEWLIDGVENATPEGGGGLLIGPSGWFSRSAGVEWAAA